MPGIRTYIHIHMYTLDSHTNTHSHTLVWKSCTWGLLAWTLCSLQNTTLTLHVHVQDPWRKWHWLSRCGRVSRPHVTRSLVRSSPCIHVHMQCWQNSMHTNWFVFPIHIGMHIQIHIFYKGACPVLPSWDCQDTWYMKAIFITKPRMSHGI
jgi:hypothetical protein